MIKMTKIMNVKKIFLLCLLLFIYIVNYAQNVCIDTCYCVLKDTIVYNNSEYNKKQKIKRSYKNINVYVKINADDKCIYSRLSSDYNPFNREFSPRIIKLVYDNYINCAYLVMYYLENFTIEVIDINECLKLEEPCGYDEGNIISINQDIYDYIGDNYLKLKDIDVKLDENYLTLLCYKYYKNLVVFRYDFNTKEWTILEDRKLTEEEIAKCGLYE